MERLPIAVLHAFLVAPLFLLPCLFILLRCALFVFACLSFSPPSSSLVPFPLRGHDVACETKTAYPPSPDTTPTPGVNGLVCLRASRLCDLRFLSFVSFARLPASPLSCLGSGIPRSSTNHISSFAGTPCLRLRNRQHSSYSNPSAPLPRRIIRAVRVHRIALPLDRLSTPFMNAICEHRDSWSMHGV